MSELTDIYRINVLKESADRLHDTGDDYRLLLDLAGEASVVLLGEATHGTHEFYRERAQITKRLIRDKGFCAVAIEGDWPDAHRVNQYVTGRGSDLEASDALSGFVRFPTWMWANADVLDFAGWLRTHNENLSAGQSPVGFYGLDLYSLYSSAQEVISFLESVDPAAAERARHRYGCFEHFGHDSQAYAYATHLGLERSCEDAVVAQLQELLQRRLHDHTSSHAGLDEEEAFNAEQNSHLVLAAEHYYRTMLDQEVSSWNLRDEHMVDTLERIRLHLTTHGARAKVVVWAHNSHVGDARATSMGRRGEWSIGQIARQKYGSEAVSIGFTTSEGTVTAASRWDGATERKHVRPALPGSYEELFHRTGMPRFFLDLRHKREAARVLKAPMLERAIGVLYLPETERLSHYFEASLPAQFDGIIHIDRTRAVEPIAHAKRWNVAEEVPETYPSGI